MREAHAPRALALGEGAFFLIWSKIVKLIYEKKHLSIEGKNQILSLKSQHHDLRSLENI